MRIDRRIGLILFALVLMACDLLSQPVEVTQPARTESPTAAPQVSLTPNYEATLVVTGSLEVAKGRDIIGGWAGETVQVPLTFEASSPLGKVTDMRVGDGDWEPFVAEKSFPAKIIINWASVGFCVQYRDEKGNLSPKICKSKTSEGMPKPPTRQP